MQSGQSDAARTSSSFTALEYRPIIITFVELMASLTFSQKADTTTALSKYITFC
jgi:hypothetical protein